jgi:hypothetical protein
MRSNYVHHIWTILDVPSTLCSSACTPVAVTCLRNSPVLTCVRTSRYGGPGSQLVDASFNIDWHAYLACSLQYVIVIVDGRGTGYKGRALRNPVKGNLGFWEVRDQINAAR